MLRGLEKCEKSLNQYLEKKRKRFPRFYFISPAALLFILSNGYNPVSVQVGLFSRMLSSSVVVTCCWWRGSGECG